ncbi:MAG: DNA repair protein RecN [Clostridia bacterium]|nr:DNA repair protein RecN [Clostridia bacterium]
MIKSLHIENLAIIRRMDLELNPGFICLTGETGAGKTLIVGSLTMLCGGKVSKDIIRTGEKKAKVSALFTGLSDSVKELMDEMGLPYEGDSLLIQKTLDASGRGSAWCNGQPITAGMHQRIGELLLSIHGQNDNQRLLKKSEQVRLLDQYAHLDEAVRQYRVLYRRLTELEEECRSLGKEASELIREKEMLEYEIREIDSQKLKPGEEEHAEALLEKLKHAEKIQKQLDFAYYLLRGSEKAAAATVVQKASESLEKISGILPELQPLIAELTTLSERLESLSEEIADFNRENEGDVGEKIDRLEGRLHAIARLKRKYGATIEEILSFRDRAHARLQALDHHEDRMADLEAEISKIRSEAQTAAAEISSVRAATARKIERQVKATLAYLDMPNVQFQIRQQRLESLGANGLDDVEFMLAANPGQDLAPLARSASGGELARVMLSIKSVFNSESAVDVSVFDEVDTGISGKTARKVGLKLKQISSGSQVICVTHSAQIASLAGQHFRIAKQTDGEQTEAYMTELDLDERVEELARILGGLHVTDAQRKAAQDMMNEEEP